MGLRVSKGVISFIFVLILFMSSANIVYADSMKDYQGRVKEYHYNETHSTNGLKSLSISNIVDSEKSYVYPEVLSSNINKINYMYFNLRDGDRNKVTGIKVNKIEIFQNGNKLVSTGDVKSYSIIGKYRINSAELLGNFLNSNGENKVDIVFYLFDKEVARIDNYTFRLFSEVIVSDVWPTDFGLDSLKIPNEVRILNAGENDIIDVWLEDENGTKVTEYDGLYDSWYSNDEKELTVSSKLSFKNSSYLNSDKEYSFVVEINGKKLDFVDDWNEIYFDSESLVYLSYSPEDDDKYYYHVGGVNLLNNGPYKLEIEQNGKVTGSIGNISATLEDDYFVMINQEITSLLSNPGEQYTTFLYDKNGNIVDKETWMEPVDEIEEDVITPDDGAANTLQSIAVTTPATKLSYSIGDKLDITGLVITGTYNDGSTKAENITAANISGFNSATAVVDQVLSITVGGKTTTYKVQIVAATDTSGMIEIKTALPTVGPSKVWTIKLNGPVNEASIKDKIYITNSQGIKQIPTCTVTTDNGLSQIKVKPDINYTPDDYILWVRDIESVKGTKIQSQVYLKFTVE